MLIIFGVCFACCTLRPFSYSLKTVITGFLQSSNRHPASRSSLSSLRFSSGFAEKVMFQFLKRPTATSSAKGAGGTDVVDHLLQRLLDRLGHQPMPLSFKAEDMMLLNSRARNVLLNQPMLVETDVPAKVSRVELPPGNHQKRFVFRSSGILTASFTTCYACSTFAATRLRLDTYSWATTSIGANSHWNRSASFWP